MGGRGERWTDVDEAEITEFIILSLGRRIFGNVCEDAHCAPKFQHGLLQYFDSVFLQISSTTCCDSGRVGKLEIISK